MTSYRCTNCNYSFSSKNEKQPRRCPYCAEADKLINESKIIDDVLHE